ncbi:amidohydrolase family protein [Leucobacter insecticola]|uniref:amidohydrolase family protein n=1 Tax=Leucobacter insecticola TaxID=2714934 RepID=UPI00244E323A|nr:amidohydrolase family protein [Leucobacter insecticola]
MLATGARLTLGSDWPVAQLDPRIGLAWARGRHTPGADPSAVFEPEQQLSGEEALLAYTLWPALARGHEDRGHLSVGCLGDLTVFGGDPVTTPVDELLELPVLLTVVDGEIVYRNPAV